MEQGRKSRHKPVHLWAPYFDRGNKNIQWRKYSLFNKWYWENWTSYTQKNETEHFLIPYSKKLKMN